MQEASVPRSPSSPAKLPVVVLAYSAVPLLILANAFWFPRIAGIGYLQWYVSNGAIISLALGFIALVWEDLEEREGLLSANPVAYFAACSTLAGVLTFSVGTHLRSTRGRYSVARGPFGTAEMYWDQLVSTVVALLLSLITVGWVFIIAPLAYVTTLVAGAPARIALRGESRRSYVRRVGRDIFIEDGIAEEVARTEDQAVNRVDVSFGRKPFAVTQALSALVLTLVKYVIA